MLGKPLVILSLHSYFSPIRPLGKLYHPLMSPLFSESSLWYLLEQYKQVGVDTVLLLLSSDLLANFKHIKPGLLSLGLTLKVIHAESVDWKSQIMDWVSDEDPVFLSVNPCLDTEGFVPFLKFHQHQQSDCSFKLRASAQGTGRRLYLDDENQVSLSEVPAALAYYDSSEYILEADILEALLANSLNLSRPSLAIELNDLSQYISGYLSKDAAPLLWSSLSQYWQREQLWLSEQTFSPQGRQQQLADALIWVGEDAYWDSSVSFTGPVVIGRQAQIQKNVKIIGPAVIGAAACIQENSQIVRSCLWPQSQVAENVQIEDSCLAENVRIGAGSRLKRQWVGSHSELSLQSGCLPETYWGNYSYYGF